MFSRLVFEVKRRQVFPEPAFIAAVVMPAQYEGLRGEFTVKSGDRYVAVLEGSEDTVTRFKTFIETLEAAVGEVSGLEVTHHHEESGFKSRLVRLVFPE